MMLKNRYKVILISAVAILAAAFFIWRTGVLTPLKIKHIELINLPGNRLRFKVIINCNKDCKSYIKYWKKNSRDTFYTAETGISLIDNVDIVNTEAESNYSFVAVARSGFRSYESNVHDFKTELIYHATPYFDLEYVDKSFEPKIHNKYFLSQILTEPGSLVIINSRGNIVWYEPFKKGVKVSHWTNDGKILCITGLEKIPSSGGDEIYEMDLSGAILRHLKVGQGGMDKLVHHEVRLDRNNNLYALTFTNKVADLSKVGGVKKDTLHGDGIVLFNKFNKKTWEWSVLDYLDPFKEPKILKLKKDWVHANSLVRDNEGNFFISFRDLSQIWKVRYPDGKVLWKLGNKGDFKIDSAEMFSGQHSVHFDEAGHLVLLDNGVKRKQSRGMVFKLDTVHKTAKALEITPLAKTYFSATKGNLSIMDDDKRLFCMTDPRVFLVTDKSGKVLWKVNLAGDPYRLDEAKGFLKSKPE